LGFRRRTRGDTRIRAPGTLLAARYRVVYPLGRGGIDQVCRADDLKLGQTVALKFVHSDMPSTAKQRLYDIGKIPC